MKTEARRPILWLIALLFISSVTRDDFADNGAVALARPVKQITVDGDFADWPSALPWYPIESPEFGKPTHAATDLSGSFRVGYDQNALYVAVEVRDDSIVIDGTRRWQSQDGCSVFLDIEHHDDDTKPIQYNIYGEGSPLYESESSKVVSWSCQRSGTLYRFEWRFDINGISGPQVKLEPGRVVGFDIALCDKDEDGSFSWVSWGAGPQKSVSSTRLGDIMIVSADDDLGVVRGRLVGETISEPFRRQAVKLQHRFQTSPVTVMSNDRGEFEVILPVGEYSAFTSSTISSQRFQVTAGGESRIELHAMATTGQPIKAALGSVVAAGKSTRIGQLHRYVAPSGEVKEVTQAADGSLWIAGWTGLASFDGRFVTVLEDENGRPVKCQAVAIDQQGIVWGANPMCLYRYDGKSVIRYMNVHGLVPGHVKQLIPMSDGSLWIRTNYGISRFAAGSFTSIYHESGAGALSTFAVESPTRIWFGTISHGIVRLDAQENADEESWQETRFRTEDGLAGDRVRALLIDSTGKLWIGGVGGLA